MRNKIEKKTAKIYLKAAFKYTLFEFLSWENQVSSKRENGNFLVDDKKNVEEKKGIIKRERRTIPVGNILRNKFVEKSKEEKRSFIIW